MIHTGEERLPTPSPGARHDNHFNLIRMVLATLVIVSHSPEIIYGDRSHELLTRLFHTLSFGDFAVNGFFLLSGYLIVQSWQLSPLAGSFLKKRILRIYPGFIAASLVCALLIGPFAGNADYWLHFRWPTFLAGMLRLDEPAIPPVFQGSHHPFINASMWTIPYEFICYLLVLAFGMTSGARMKTAWGVTTAAIALVDLTNGAGLTAFHPLGPHYLSFFTFFFFGGSYYLFRDHISFSRQGALIALALFILTMFSRRFVELGDALFFGYLLFGMAGAKCGRLLAYNRLPDISYGVYLYAWPVGKLLLAARPDTSATALVMQTFVLAVACGLASWYLVERPFLRLKTLRMPWTMTA